MLNIFARTFTNAGRRAPGTEVQTDRHGDRLSRALRRPLRMEQDIRFGDGRR